jgi:hypothetical protein
MASYSAHQCRRAYAGVAAHVLKSPYLVKSLMNHAMSEITERYIVIDFQQKSEAAEAVAAWLMEKLTGSASIAPLKLLEFKGEADSRAA